MDKIVHTEWSDGPMARVKYFITQEEDGTRWMCKVNRSGVGREEEEATPGDRVYDVTSYGDNWWGILSDYNDRILNLHHAGNKSIPVARTPLISFRSEKWEGWSLFDVLEREKSLTYAQIKKIMEDEKMEVCADGVCRYINRCVINAR